MPSSNCVWAVNALDIIQDYKDDHHIDIDPNATPVIQPPCKVWISLMEKLKAELECMWKLNVIEKINEPIDWVSSIVIVEKGNGQLHKFV